MYQMKGLILSAFTKLIINLAFCAVLFLPQLASAKPSLYVLDVELSPAVCAINTSQRGMKKCLEGFALTVTGLTPDVSRRFCHTSARMHLAPVQARVVARIIPDDQVRRDAWRRAGGCVEMHASQYFRLIVNYASELKIPSELTSTGLLKINRDLFLRRIVRLNSRMSERSIRLSCRVNTQMRRTYLTEMHICYSSSGRFASCPRQVRNSCPGQFHIQGPS